MWQVIKAILGLIPAILFGIILFLINPILGVLWILWIVILVIWVVRKDLIMTFLGRVFGAKK